MYGINSRPQAGDQGQRMTRAICKTEAGNPENQDRGLVVISDNRQVLVVADGAGGRSGAAEAASMAVEFVRGHAEQLNSTRDCVVLLKEMDSAIARDPVAGETTVTIAVV